MSGIFWATFRDFLNNFSVIIEQLVDRATARGVVLEEG